MEIKLKLITKWLTDSNLKENGNETEICLFTEKIPSHLESLLTTL